MKKFLQTIVVAAVALMLFSGCAQKAAYTRSDLDMKLASGKVVQKTNNFVVLYDTSSSMAEPYGTSRRMEFAEGITRGMAATIPDIKLTAGLRNFGGFKGEEKTELVYGMTSFNRDDFTKALDTLGLPVGRTPLGRTIEAAGEDLKGLPGKSAVIIVSDFQDIKGIDDIRPDTAIASAAAVRAQYGDRICIYAVQIGKAPPPGGETLAQAVVREGKCGIAVNAEDIKTPAAMADFVETVFLGPPAPARAEQPPPPAVIQEEKQAEAAAAPVAEPVAFENIHFDFDKYNLKPEAKAILDKLGEYMKENSEATVLIEGHCDERGTAEYNMALGQRRASSAEKYLVSLGVEKKRIKTVSYGESRPLDPAHNEEAWAKNRRDQFIMTEK
jgi:OmpA-OmpF porin, OOP family